MVRKDCTDVNVKDISYFTARKYARINAHKEMAKSVAIVTYLPLPSYEWYVCAKFATCCFVTAKNGFLGTILVLLVPKKQCTNRTELGISQGKHSI